LLIVPIVICLALTLPSVRLSNLLPDDRGQGALDRNDVGRLEEQLRGGMDVNAVDSIGSTPLMAAAQMGRAEIARVLIRHGASVTARSACGLTPLAYAACSGDAETVVLLLQKGADPNTVDTVGNTPLIWAVQSGNVDKVRALLAAGADRNPVNHSGWSAADSAREYGHRHIAMLLSR
jgi:hypothetical protein